MPKEKEEKEECFVMMPITDPAGYDKGHFYNVYKDIISKACELAGYQPIRADDILGTSSIPQDVLNRIDETPMAICDLSSQNPNVMYELGLRHQVFKKPVVLIQEKGTPAISNIASLRYTEYRKEMLYNQVEEDQRSISAAITATKEKEFNSPDDLLIQEKTNGAQYWKKLALLSSEYVTKDPMDHRVYFYRGVAFANLQGGKSNDTIALLNYSNALEISPSTLDSNRRARYLSYRGAMYKRLGRLEEAFKDLKDAEYLASDYYETHDIKYNMACVYAMQGNREKLFEMVRELKNAPNDLARIRYHLCDYFKLFKNDKEFLDAIGSNVSTVR